MTPLKNFFHVLKKYKIASLLNVIGLSIAFASFMIIMTQVKYDLSFDRHYKKCGSDIPGRKSGNDRKRKSIAPTPPAWWRKRCSQQNPKSKKRD